MTSSSLTKRLSPAQTWWKQNAKYVFYISLTLFILSLVWASTRMTILAFESQPECVPHSQSKDGEVTQHRAAKSSC